MAALANVKMLRDVTPAVMDTTYNDLYGKLLAKLLGPDTAEVKVDYILSIWALRLKQHGQDFIIKLEALNKY